MNWRMMFAGWRSLLPGGRTKAPRGAFTSETFRTIVAREQARVRRNAHRFSLILFEVPEASRRCAYAQRLVNELNRRVRFTDVIGCYDADRIGTLLPETDAIGAQSFALNVREQFCLPGEALRFDVRTYPDDAEFEPPRNREPLDKGRASDRESPVSLPWPDSAPGSICRSVA